VREKYSSVAATNRYVNRRSGAKWDCSCYSCYSGL